MSLPVREFPYPSSNEAQEAVLQLSREERLLLICARVELDQEGQMELGALLTEGLDWAVLLEKATWHRLSGLTYHHLQSPQYKSMVPPTVLGQLGAVYHHNIVRRLCQQVELHGILGTLAAREIPVIVLKGAALVESVYRNPGLRPMNDVDILVHPEDAETVARLVADAGYSPKCSKEVQERTRVDHNHLPLMVAADKPVMFEVHHHIVRRDSTLHFDLSSFWSNARQATIAGSQALVLSPEHMIVHLCLHFFSDRRYRTNGALAQLCDIAETIRCYSPSLDWSLLTAQVKDLGITGPVYYPVRWARELFSAPVSNPVVDGLRPRDLDEDAAALFLRRRVLDTRDFLAHELVPSHRKYGVTAVTTSLAKRLIPNRVTLAEHYGLSSASGRVYLYYPVRWFEGLSKIARMAIRPAEMRREFDMDRWMHQVLSQGTSGSGTYRKGA